MMTTRDEQRNALIDFKMPGAILDEIETVQGIVRQLDEDVRTSPVPEDFKRTWRAFADEWARFYAAHRGWWSRTWYAVYEKTRDFRRRTEAWRVALLAAGGHTALPRDTIDDDGLKTYLLVGAGALGVGLLWWLTARRRGADEGRRRQEA